MNLKIEYLNVDEIRPYENNPRKHDMEQIKKIADSITEFNFTNPVLIDENNVLLAGHGRLLAAKKLKIENVPCVRITYLTENQKRAYRIADNNLTLLGDWDIDLLGLELKELSEQDLDFDIEVTGFEVPEIEAFIQKSDKKDLEKDPLDEIPEVSETEVVAKNGDIWQLGNHLIYCGNSLDEESYLKIMGDSRAQMIFTDPPYNVKIDGHVCGNGRIKYDDFAMACGEMSREEFTSFLHDAFAKLCKYSVDGALHYLCMDWRHIIEITTACDKLYSEMKNLCIWNKAAGGMGSLYRSKHELIFVYKYGTAPHVNNVKLGVNGRNRTNVWDYPGVNTFGGNRDDLLLHPTVKNVEMVVDAILDVTRPKDIVLDSFLGSGTTLIACEKTGRVCRGIELEPKYIDVTIKRWQKMTGQDAINVNLNKTYNELLQEVQHAE